MTTLTKTQPAEVLIPATQEPVGLGTALGHVWFAIQHLITSFVTWILSFVWGSKPTPKQSLNPTSVTTVEQSCKPEPAPAPGSDLVLKTKKIRGEDGKLLVDSEYNKEDGVTRKETPNYEHRESGDSEDGECASPNLTSSNESNTARNGIDDITSQIPSNGSVGSSAQLIPEDYNTTRRASLVNTQHSTDDEDEDSESDSDNCLEESTESSSEDDDIGSTCERYKAFTHAVTGLENDVRTSDPWPRRRREDSSEDVRARREQRRRHRVKRTLASTVRRNSIHNSSNSNIKSLTSSGSTATTEDDTSDATVAPSKKQIKKAQKKAKYEAKDLMMFYARNKNAQRSNRTQFNVIDDDAPPPATLLDSLHNTFGAPNLHVGDAIKRVAKGLDGSGSYGLDSEDEENLPVVAREIKERDASKIEKKKKKERKQEKKELKAQRKAEKKAQKQQKKLDKKQSHRKSNNSSSADDKDTTTAGNHSNIITRSAPVVATSFNNNNNGSFSSSSAILSEVSPRKLSFAVADDNDSDSNTVVIVTGEHDDNNNHDNNTHSNTHNNNNNNNSSSDNSDDEQYSEDDTMEDGSVMTETAGESTEESASAIVSRRGRADAVAAAAGDTKPGNAKSLHKTKSWRNKRFSRVFRSK
eukprot:TRINITY_DN688_c0_g1_i1.p1 TRINITY_DN688_c0_g1~~TRINITY_DN688_c0_g1_i1.p1  ORF type:complete len:640 (-),score=199.35 TRINITY_DN688_c0_g1_i1:23-1942(-)